MWDLTLPTPAPVLIFHWHLPHKSPVNLVQSWHLHLEEPTLETGGSRIGVKEVTPFLINLSDPLGNIEGPITMTLSFVGLEGLVAHRRSFIELQATTTTRELWTFTLREPAWKQTLTCKS